MFYHFHLWAQCPKAATAIEYALLAGGIAAACLAAFFAMGDSIEGILNDLGAALRNID